MTLRIVLVAVTLACSGAEEKPRLPTEAELQAACPEAFEAATLECGAIAVKYCAGYDTLDECPRGEQARADCRAHRERELARCR